MMGRGRTHHHVSKKRSEDLSRRPITAMECFFITPNPTSSSQTMPDVSVTYTAVKEDRHQNIMSSAVSEEGNRGTPGQLKDGARFINLFGYRGDHS